MKRAFFRLALAAAATAIILTGSLAATTARACQYCRMALEDPEAARMITDNHGGGFPLDGSLGQYQAPPVSADLKAAPAADSIVTSASALKASMPPAATTASAAAPMAIHRAVLPPPAAPVVVAAKAPAATPAVNPALSHWLDFCLLGLVAAGGVFCWRTRRPAGDAGVK